MRPDEAPIASDAALDVPGLGTITGLRFEKTCQYLGIPYADVPGRFRRSLPVEKWENGKWDGTKLGPYCPQPPRDFYPVPSPSRPWLETPPEDELNCLNLNISVPQLPTETADKKLPVMVFLHGGAFAYSTGSSPIYDGRILADVSRQTLGRPTILVTLNYRLGVYGFLAGSDLKEFNESHGDRGVGNNGIWDQVLALRWIQKHIGAFGGDASRITLFGQSAGGVSVHCHLLRNEPLFSAAILQSGLVRLCGVMSVAEHQILFEKMLKELGIDSSLPPLERVKRLAAVPTKDLTMAMIPVYCIPVITMALCDDGVLLPQGMPRSDQYADSSFLQAPSWCPRIMLGDCRKECIIWNKGWVPMTTLGALKAGADLAEPEAPLVMKRLTKVLGSEANVAAIAGPYGLSADLPPQETFDRLERMTSHGMFSLPIYFATKAYSQTPGAKVYAWHFDVPSPFDNAWGGMAHHSFDNVLLWGILQGILPEEHKQAGVQMREAFIKFANGEQPWEAYSEKQRWMVMSKDGFKLATDEEDPSWGSAIFNEIHSKGLGGIMEDASTEICLRREAQLTK